MTDDEDRPEAEGMRMELVVPFIVCTSKGGPYDDDSFVAGFVAGEIDRALSVAAAAGADRLTRTVRTALVPQLELLAMQHGFLHMHAVEVTETPDYPAMPEWSFVTFSTVGPPKPEETP